VKPSPLARLLSLLRLFCLLCLPCAPVLARHQQTAEVGGVPGQFDYYLLALSWSPAYCLTHSEDRDQCGSKGLGWVLHGLWPQYDSGRYPEYCSGLQLSPQASALGLTVYVSPRLMQHEWQSHGTCSGMDAVQYFRTADRALAVVQVPALFEAPRTSQNLSGAQIAAAFHAANPSLPAEGLTVLCSRGQLSEVRVCLTRELALRACGRGVRSNCPDAAVLVPSSR
jgi:ribonuclease T2